MTQVPVERRKHPRRSVSYPAQIDVAGKLRDCTVCELSEGGARILVDHAHEVPGKFRLVSPTDDRYCRIMWRDEKAIGVMWDSVRRPGSFSGGRLVSQVAKPDLSRP